MSLEIPSEITEDLGKTQIYNVIVKMKNFGQVLQQFGRSKRENKLEDRSEEIIWNVAQRDNMVENTDEMSIYLIIPLFSSSKTEQTKFCYSGFICGSFGGVQRLYFLT